MVAIGASGGEGLGDIKALMATLPLGLPAVVFAVLHRPSDRPSNLRAVLSCVSSLPIMKSSEAGCCYIGEPNAHLSLAAR